MSTDAEQAHSPHGTPPPRPAHPPRTAPERPSAPPSRSANAPGFTPDPETPVLGVRAKAPFSRGTAEASGTRVGGWSFLGGRHFEGRFTGGTDPRGIVDQGYDTT
ncbi:hypothetical protein ACWEWX_49375, partial [Streptomyces asiaticus]